MSDVQTRQRCSGCGELKPVSEFAWHRPALEQLHTYCRACQADFLTNRDRDLAQATRRKQGLAEQHAEYLLDFLSERSCVDCSEEDPLVLEFDHLRDKRFNISQGLSERPWQEILDEIAKCEVVCANCHRRRTALRAGPARVAALQRRRVEFLSGDDDCARRRRGRHGRPSDEPRS